MIKFAFTTETEHKNYVVYDMSKWGKIIQFRYTLKCQLPFLSLMGQYKKNLNQMILELFFFSV